MSESKKQQLQEALMDYATAIHKHGALCGDTGAQKFHHDVGRLLEGIHKVLAGAEIKQVHLDERRMNGDVFRELQEAAQRPIDVFNEGQGSVEYG